MIWLKLLKRILVHKYYVAKYCFQIGLYWQGITHDLSKFSWIEFSRSIKYWDDNQSSLAKEREVLGYSKTFLHHRGHNPHHYEYWIHSLDGEGVPSKMPKKYVLELICDYLAAAKTYGNNPREEYNWWIRHRDELKIHSDTKEYSTQVFYNYYIGLSLKKSIYGNY
jgi:hypothetical protein